MPNSGLRILIVEDQFLIAKQLEMIMIGAGHVVVGTCANKTEACDLAASERPDVAFVDVSLADGSTGLEVATFITSQCAGYVVFTTANGRRVPTDYCGAIGIVEKPFSRLGLLLALNFIAAHMRGARNQLPRPESLRLSPDYKERWAG